MIIFNNDNNNNNKKKKKKKKNYNARICSAQIPYGYAEMHITGKIPVQTKPNPNKPKIDITIWLT